MPYADLTGRGNDLTVYPDPNTGASPAPFEVGSTAGSQTIDAYVAHLGIWARDLTTTEVNALNSGDVCAGSPCSYTLTSLNADLKCYYGLGQASGTAVHFLDTSGNSCPDLVGSGATTQQTGPLGGADKATYFTGGVSASTTSLAKLSCGSGACSMAISANLKSLAAGTQEIIVGQNDIVSSPAETGPVIYYQGQGAAQHSWNYDHGNGVDLFRNGVVINRALGAPVANQWYSLVSTYGTDGLQKLYVDGSANVSTFDRNSYIPPQFGLAVPLSFPGTNAYQGWDCGGDCTGTLGVGLTGASSNDLGLGGDSTFAGWIQANSTTPTQVIAARANSANPNFQVSLSGGTLTFKVGDSTTSDSVTATLPDSLWHLIVMSYDASGVLGTANNLYVWVDNVLAASKVTSVAPTRGGLPLFVGGTQTGSNVHSVASPLLGNVSRFMFATGVPSAADLNALWNGGLGIR